MSSSCRPLPLCSLNLLTCKDPCFQFTALVRPLCSACHNNQLSHCILHIEYNGMLCGYLQDLRLSGTTITNTACKYIGQMTSLLHLELNCTAVGDQGAAFLVTLKDLRGLHMISCSIGDIGVSSIAQLTSLEELNLYGTRVGDGSCQYLACLVNLRKLGIDWTRLEVHNKAALRKSLPMLEDSTRVG